VRTAFERHTTLVEHTEMPHKRPVMTGASRSASEAHGTVFVSGSAMPNW
jgi:hypothetical protein